MGFQRVTMISLHSPELFLQLLEKFLLADSDCEGRIWFAPSFSILWYWQFLPWKRT